MSGYCDYCEYKEDCDFECIGSLFYENYEDNKEEENTMVKYEVRVSVKPEIHNGSMKHMWQLMQINEDGCFTILSGFEEDFFNAMASAYREVEDRVNID